MGRNDNLGFDIPGAGRGRGGSRRNDLDLGMPTGGRGGLNDDLSMPTGGGRSGGRNNRAGGYNQGGYNQGGYNQGGYNQGGYNQGDYNQGGYNQDDYNQGMNDPNMGGNPGGQNTGRSQNRKLPNIGLFFVSVIFGLAGAFAGLFLYNLLKDSLFRPLVIGLTVLVFFVILSLGVVLFSLITGKYSNGPGKALLAVLLFTVGIFAATVLFEFIYELGGIGGYKKPTSYLILLDDSPSMNGNDGSLQRYAAIKDIMQDMDEDFPYALYSFSDNVVSIRDMAPKGDDDFNYSIPNDVSRGGTATLTSLLSILSDYKSGKIDGGTSPKILLLSDGEAGDNDAQDLRDIINQCNDMGISISTVGLGLNMSSARQLMEQLAGATGGVYVDVTEVGKLKQAMGQAVSSYATRDMLTFRSVQSNNILYFIERVVFMGIIGILVTIAMLFAAGILGGDMGLTLIIGIVKALIASLLLELLINTFMIPSGIVDLIYFVLVAMIFAVYRKRDRNGQWGDGAEAWQYQSHAVPGVANGFGRDSRRGPSDDFERGLRR